MNYSDAHKIINSSYGITDLTDDWIIGKDGRGKMLLYSEKLGGVSYF